jgi:hypothetical protein
VTLDEAIACVTEHFKRSKYAAVYRARRKPGWAIFYYLLWVLGLTITLIIGFAAVHYDRVFGIVVTLACAAIAQQLYVRGRRAAQPTAAAQLGADLRPPVLLLRSFKDDRLIVTEKIMAMLDLDIRVHFEEGLATRLKQFGPFIGIGAPGESLPQIGAARAYLPEDQWQETVVRWIEDAGVIAMIAGNTPSVQWELSQIVSRNLTSKLVVFLPPAQSQSSDLTHERSARWQRLLEPFGATPWIAQLGAIDATAVLALMFAPAGRIVAVRCKSELMQDYEVALIIACYAMFCYDWT